MTSETEINLTTHRAVTSVWERRGWDGTPDRPTVGRYLVAAGGGALAVQGVRLGLRAGARHRTLGGALLACAGAGLAWWALAGDGDLSNVPRQIAAFLKRTRDRDDDAIHEASSDSFPASDAPSWTPTVGTGVRHRRMVPG